MVRDVHHLLGISFPTARRELQADCLAGVWVYSTRPRGALAPAAIDAGLAAVADAVRGRPAGPGSERFDHASQSERLASFRRGYETGRGRACAGSAGRYG